MSQVKLIDGLINGIGGTIGGGVFLLIGEVVKENRGNAYLSFLMAAIMCLTVAFCYCILSKEYPSKEGTAEYPKRIFKNRTIQLLVNGLIVFGYTSLFCIYSLSAGNYLANFINKSYMNKKISALIVTICMLLSFMPPTLFNQMQTGFVATKLFVLLVIIIIGFVKGNNKSNILSQSRMKSGGGNKNDPIKALMDSLGVFVTYEGFEMNSIFSSTMENPNINIPNSYFMTILTGAVVYIGLSIVTNNFIGNKITTSNSASALIDLVKAFGYTTYGPIIVVITNMIANVSANIATIGSLEPIVNNYVKDLKIENSILNKHVTILGNTKSVALMLTCVVAIIAILFGPSKIVTHSGSLSFLLIFTIVCLMTIMTIFKKEQAKEKITIYNKEIDYTVCKLVSGMGFLICSSGFVKLIYSILQEGL